jgi:hypothetical protein
MMNPVFMKSGVFQSMESSILHGTIVRKNAGRQDQTLPDGKP